jgi:hypothetical protein
MGTRSLTVLQEESGKEIAVLYRQYDGYLGGHGKELVDFLRDFNVVNGFTSKDKERKVANGPGCLAGQIVSHFKRGVGDFYLYPAGTRDCGEEYVYYIIPSLEKGINLKVINDDGDIILNKLVHDIKDSDLKE